MTRKTTGGDKGPFLKENRDRVNKGESLEGDEANLVAIFLSRRMTLIKLGVWGIGGNVF